MAMLLSSACVSPLGLVSLGLNSGSSTRHKTTVVSKCGLSQTSTVAGNSKKTLYKSGSSAPFPKSLGFFGSSILENHVRRSQLDTLDMESSGGGALGSMCSLPASVETLRWVLVAAATTLLFLRNVTIPKQYLVPLLALELPREAFNWLRGEYGLWTAFVALLVKLFYNIPEELKLPLYTLVLVITAPAQISQYRGSSAGALASLVLALYLGVQHYRSVGNVKEAFKSDKLIPTLAILALVIVPILFFVNSVYV